MWQAILDENDLVVTVNDWENSVGIPCDSETPIGYRWTGSGFVEPQSSIEKRLSARLTQHFDEVAQSKQYDNRITCALRSGYAGPYQHDGIAFGSWMDNCNAYAYTIYSEIASGTIALMTEDEFIALMPPMAWPI